MDTETMIRELRRLAEKHKDDVVHTGQNNWSDMCTDVANRLEYLDFENKALKVNNNIIAAQRDSLISLVNNNRDAIADAIENLKFTLNNIEVILKDKEGLS